MSVIVGIDPGKKHSGVAILVDGVLDWVELQKREFDCSIDYPTAEQPWEMIIEVPQVYRHGKGDQNDLIEVAVVSGMWLQAAYNKCYKPKLVRPREWKGSVPKKIHNNRILAKLSEAERRLLEEIPSYLRHNVIDAVGIALWRAGR